MVFEYRNKEAMYSMKALWVAGRLDEVDNGQGEVAVVIVRADLLAEALTRQHDACAVRRSVRPECTCDRLYERVNGHVGDGRVEDGPAALLVDVALGKVQAEGVVNDEVLHAADHARAENCVCDESAVQRGVGRDVGAPFVTADQEGHGRRASGPEPAHGRDRCGSRRAGTSSCRRHRCGILAMDSRQE
jgi:hypothetical protein